MTTPEFFWVGIAPCGCVVAGQSEDSSLQYVAEGIGEMILRGLKVERRKGPVTIVGCIHESPKSPATDAGGGAE